jgi:DNA adenine methylase
MLQPSLFDETVLRKIVNVASVPHRSPFRYPGGKTWLVPYIRRWIGSQLHHPVEHFFEPFAGGGIVGLTVAAEKLANHVTLVELDENIASVWQTILGGHGEWLANRIISFEVNETMVDFILDREPPSLRERAFQTILKNRVNHGGIMANGAGRLKYGENGKGMKSRWYPQTLKNRILDIVKIGEKITFIQGDGFEIMRQNLENQNVLFFIDPPYTVAGKKAGSRLYRHSEVNHNELFELADQINGDFLMTYDNAEGVMDLANEHHFDTHIVAMKNTHNTKMTELLIGRNLDWARSL